jgi:alcohol dehydrogenase
MSTMRALVYSQFGGVPAVEQVAIPTPAADGVVISVQATGLCRSDWHGWVGHDSDVALPHVGGHEYAGVISAVGADVTRLKVGDRVTVPFVCGCGTCEFCLSGNAQVCPNQKQPGFDLWGSFAEYVAVPWADFNVVPLPDAVSFDVAAALGCRFATSFRAIVHQGAVTRDQWVVVYGSGGIGLSCIMIAAALGARVIAVDISDSALELARANGAAETINSSLLDPVAETVRLTGIGAHVSIDALGNAAVAQSAIRSLRRQGRHVQVGLLPSDSGLSEIPMGAVIAQELQVYGSHGMAAASYPEMLQMVASGELTPQSLINRVISLEEAGPALMVADRNSGGMTIIHPSLVK